MDGVEKGKLLLLDLYAEKYPQWKRTNSFYGHSYIWCNLHNFGGNIDMHGSMSNITDVKMIFNKDWIKLMIGYSRGY